MNTITALHDEIEQLHRDCMDDLNRQAWACDDMLTELEAMGDELAAHFEAAQLRTGRRLRLARIIRAMYLIMRVSAVELAQSTAPCLEMLRFFNIPQHAGGVICTNIE